MKNLALTSSQATSSRMSDSEADSDLPASQLEEDDLETVERESAEAAQTSRMTSKKRRKKQVYQKEWMKELRETMKANQQLLSQLIEEKPANSEREVFIKYVADSLHAAPVDEYKKMRTKIFTLIDSQKDAPEPLRPPQAMSAPRPAVPAAEPGPRPDAKHF
jgi:hypothetical protein